MRIKLSYWRNKRVLSISMLAKRAKVSPATIVNIEKGHRVPHPDTLHKLAEALNISLDELIADEEEDHLLAA